MRKKCRSIAEAAEKFANVNSNPWFAAGLSNWIGFDLIFDQKVAETFRFDMDSIQKKNVIWYETASAVIKENRSGNWPIFKLIVRYKGIYIWQSPWRFCFVNFYFYFLSQFKVFFFRFLSKLSQVELRPTSISHYLQLGYNLIQFEQKHLVW